MLSRFHQALLIALSALGAGFLAVTPASAQQPQDSVSGSAFGCYPETCLEFPFFGQSATFDARSDPSGGGPSGTIVIDNLGPTPSSTDRSTLNVTCLSITGNRAIIGYTGRQDYDPVTAFWIAGFIRVVDGGTAGSGLDTWEDAQLDRQFVQEPEQPPLPGPSQCSSFPATGASSFVNARGDVVVTDSPSLPTAKQQCTDGSWRNYGTQFKNQGQCVAFVQRGAKP